jgi:hypothetical protein
MKPVLLLFLAAAAMASAQAKEPSREEAHAALDKAVDYLRSISTEGGYLWRYSLDLKERSGEVKASDSQAWVQPPGTPAVGMAFLRAFSATKDDRFFDAATAVAEALARGQLESGGWDYLIEFDPQKRRAWSYRSDRASSTDASPSINAARKNVSTYDDDNTQSVGQSPDPARFAGA